MIETTLLAYLAGAMDSDGYFVVYRSTYHQRTISSTVNVSYSEKAGLRQVTPDIPYLLKEAFGGNIQLNKPSMETGKPLYSYQCSNLIAADLCTQLLPFLRIKRKQAELLLELRESKDSRFKHISYWFETEFPNWREMEMITATEAAQMLSFANTKTVHLATSTGELLVLPYTGRNLHQELPRIPRALVERMAALKAETGHLKLQPPQLTEWRERLYVEMRLLNKTGTG